MGYLLILDVECELIDFEAKVLSDLLPQESKCLEESHLYLSLYLIVWVHRIGHLDKDRLYIRQPCSQCRHFRLQWSYSLVAIQEGRQKLHDSSLVCGVLCLSLQLVHAALDEELDHLHLVLLFDHIFVKLEVQIDEQLLRCFLRLLVLRLYSYLPERVQSRQILKVFDPQHLLMVD